VDCTLCVQVCPTGIDIRKGLQYECIACAACVDACDNVMRKVCRPTGLIRYSTADGGPASRRLLRPRIMAYGAFLAALIASFAWVVAHRVPLNVDVIRDRNTLSRQLPDGRAENVYSVRIINKDSAPHAFKISAEGLDQLTVDSDAPLQWVAGESVKSVVVRVRAPARHLSGGYDIRIITRSVDAPELKGSTAARFFYKR
jgi:cytochrome c oxidase accessory protein FixG